MWIVAAVVVGLAMPTVTARPTVSTHCDFGWSGRIRKRVRLAAPRLHYCYMRAAQLDHALAGTAVMRFTIGRTGRTSQISVDGTLNHDGVRTCIAKEVATWTFSPQDDAARINYPVTFRLAGS